MRDSKTIVREGYDSISRAYRSDDFDYESSGYRPLLTEFETYLANGDRVLDLGCGCGVPVAQHLAKRCQVTGVDISPVQIDRAEKLVPGARFVCGDITELDFPASSFDAIVSFYTVIHVPREQQPEMFRKMARWLAPGGMLMLTVAAVEWTGTEAEWHGAEMYWSHAGRDVYCEWLLELGIEILAEQFIPEGNGGHPVFIARKPPGGLRSSGGLENLVP